MFLFVAMLHLPGAIALKNNRIIWTIVAREMSFGGAAWMLAAGVTDGWPARTRGVLNSVGRAFATLALFVFGVEEILHPAVLPVVPLVQEMPSWVPLRMLIGYVTGAALVATGVSVLWGKRARQTSTLLGAWILVLVLALYGPVMILACPRPAIPPSHGDRLLRRYAALWGRRARLGESDGRRHSPQQRELRLVKQRNVLPHSNEEDLLHRARGLGLEVLDAVGSVAPVAAGRVGTSSLSGLTSSSFWNA